MLNAEKTITQLEEIGKKLLNSNIVSTNDTKAINNAIKVISKHKERECSFWNGFLTATIVSIIYIILAK
jgi:hypothetical protein